MQRFEPTTEQEELLMSMGAIYLEENDLLDELYQILQPELVADLELSEDTKDFIKQHIVENFFRLDMNYSPDLRGDGLELLQEMWEVHDRASALMAIDALRTTGHRTKFNNLKGNTQSLYKFKEIFKFDFDESEEIQLSDEEFEKLATWIEKADTYVPKCGILAWDIARAVHLIRLCFFCGFLNDVEAWNKINELGPLVQGRFKSWSEFAQSFLIGRTFWAGSEDPELKSVCERLLAHEASPWLYYSITDQNPESLV